MLTIIVPGREAWDEATESFINTKTCKLQLEHSLVSVSKWESKWCKAFLSEINDKSQEEVIDYIRCMTINQVDPNVYYLLTKENIRQIMDYINAPMSATTFSEMPGAKRSREVVTSELIYYWMVASQIPFECQKWHLNRLLNLIRICGIKNQPPKKMKRNEILSRNASLNAARRAKLGTPG